MKEIETIDLWQRAFICKRCGSTFLVPTSSLETTWEEKTLCGECEEKRRGAEFTFHDGQPRLTEESPDDHRHSVSIADVLASHTDQEISHWDFKALPGRTKRQIILYYQRNIRIAFKERDPERRRKMVDMLDQQTVRVAKWLTGKLSGPSHRRRYAA